MTHGVLLKNTRYLSLLFFIIEIILRQGGFLKKTSQFVLFDRHSVTIIIHFYSVLNMTSKENKRCCRAQTEGAENKMLFWSRGILLLKSTDGRVKKKPRMSLAHTHYHIMEQSKTYTPPLKLILNKLLHKSVFFHSPSIYYLYTNFMNK